MRVWFLFYSYTFPRTRVTAIADMALRVERVCVLFRTHV